MRNQEVEINEVIANLVMESFKNFIESSKEIILRKIEKRDIDKFKIRVQRYLTSSFEKYSCINNLLFSDHSVNLYDIFFPLRLRYFDTDSGRNNFISADELSLKNLNKLKNNLIIQGVAGIGKTTLLKYLFLNAIQKKQQIPIFIELRKINLAEKDLEESKNVILEFIINELALHDFSLSKEILDYCFKTGKFILFLDGYDEVHYSLRHKMNKAIEGLNTKYKSTKMILTSRPEYFNEPFFSFTKYNICLLEPDEIYSLLKIYIKEEAVREQIMGELKGLKVSDYPIALSTPLMIILLAITYRNIGNIPPKLSLYYYQVFDALFEKHDATKMGYHRQKYSGLAKDDFLKVISFFSFSSFSRDQLTFTDQDIDEYLTLAKKYYSPFFNFDIEKVKKDILSTICLLIKEGGEYVLIHKSFQEFFSSYFLKEVSDETFNKLIPNFTMNSNLFYLFCVEMFKERISKVILIPFLARSIEYIDKIKTTSKATRAYSILQYYYAPIKIELWAYGNEMHFRWGELISDKFNNVRLFDLFYQKYYTSADIIFKDEKFVAGAYLKDLVNEALDKMNLKKSKYIVIDFSLQPKEFFSKSINKRFIDGISKVWESKKEFNLELLLHNYYNSFLGQLDANLDLTKLLFKERV